MNPVGTDIAARPLRVDLIRMLEVGIAFRFVMGHAQSRGGARFAMIGEAAQIEPIGIVGPLRVEIIPSPIPE